MPLDYDRVMDMPPVRKDQVFEARDSIIYALGVGLGSVPTDLGQLRYVWERDLQALPTMASTRAWTRFADLPLDWNYNKLVHAEQRMVLFRPMPASGAVHSVLSVDKVVDRGADKGAFVYFKRDLFETQSNELISTQLLSILARGDGGFGGPSDGVLQAHPLPDREADRVAVLECSPRSALIYRLTGDLNPLHVDPATAQGAGFQAPILHGLATYGYVGHAILREVLDYAADRLIALDGRFSAPVLPGDTLQVEFWFDADIVSIRVRVPARNVTVFTNGRAQIRL